MKKLFLKSFALVAMLLCGLTASAVSGIDWSDEVYPWIGVDANADPTNNGSKYKIEKSTGLNVASIQLRGEKCAIYVSVPAAIESATVEGVIEGAGMWMYLENFTAQETQVTIKHAQSSITFWVYYVNGVPSGESAETIKPTMTSASLAEVSHNAAVINVAGTDKETEDGADVAVTRFKVVYGETSKTYTATNEQITITGLTPGTAYSFTIYAVDAVGNVSEEGLTVAATTENRASQCSGECGHFGNPDVKRIAYTIEYNPVKKTVVYTISALNGKKLDFMEVQTTKGNFGVNIPEGGSTSCTYSQTNVNEGDEIGIRFLYSTDEIDGNEMNAADVTLSDPNIIYYKVGDCEMEEDNVAPVMESATLESKTYNSAVIAVVATDNKGVVSYNVVDDANEFEANFAAVDGKITVTGLTPNTTYNLAISAVDLAGNVSAEAKTVQVITPTFAHPSSTTVPMHASSDVFSIYSDAYTSTITRATGGWGQQTKEQEVALAEGDNAFYYTNGNFLGWELNGNTTIGDMSLFPNLHMDIYVAEAGTIKFTPIWGAEAAKEYTLVAGWNALEINLAADFKEINLKNIYQLKWDAMPAVCYIDNVYFWKDGASTAIDAADVVTKFVKTIENGQLVIIRDGVRYNVMGNVIR